MDLNPADSVGTRVALLRQRAELSQDEFAHATQVSVSVLSALERGDLPAGASFTAAAATALSVDITVLTGQPYDELVLDPRSDAGDTGVAGGARSAVQPGSHRTAAGPGRAAPPAGRAATDLRATDSMRGFARWAGIAF